MGKLELGLWDSFYVYLASAVVTASWQPYMKNFAQNATFDYGSRIAEMWLER